MPERLTLSANSDGGAMLAGPAFKRKSEVLANSEHSILLGQDVPVSWNPRERFSDILFENHLSRLLNYAWSERFLEADYGLFL